MFPRFLSISLGCFALGTLIATGASSQTCGTGTCTDTPTFEQFCFVGDGRLEDTGVGCILFRADFSSLGITATLSNYGEFSVGDRVHVEGCAEIAFTLCQVAPYHIRDNTIESLFPEPEVPALGFSGRAVAVILVAGLALWFGKRFR